MAEPVPLPPNNFNPTSQASCYNAYHLCLTVEGFQAWDPLLEQFPTIQPLSVGPLQEKWPPNVVGRFMGYALHEAPTPVGRDNMARDINACADDLLALALLTQLYVGGMTRLCTSPYISFAAILIPIYQFAVQNPLYRHQRYPWTTHKDHKL